MNTNRTQQKKVKVLVIEDDNDHWTLMEKAMALSFVEAKPIRVSSANEALELIESWLLEEWEMPKLILQDLYLPDNEDGLGFIRRIKTMPLACNRIPIVMLSSSNIRTDITEAYQLGVSSYALKPLDFQGWITLFNDLRFYWLETVTLPTTHYSL